jgi:hypothetical protein
MTDSEILPPVSTEAAQQKQAEIDVVLEQISSHELRLAKHFARLSRLVREVKVEQYWIPLGYDRFTSYLEVMRKRIGRERSQMYAVLSVAEALHPYLTDEQIEAVGITKGHELKRLVKQGGRVDAEVPGSLVPVRIMDFAADPKVTVSQLKVKVNELLHVHEAPQGLWFEIGGFYADTGERKEIQEFWELGRQVLQITSESEYVWKKEVFLAAVREFAATWRGKAADAL